MRCWKLEEAGGEGDESGPFISEIAAGDMPKGVKEKTPNVLVNRMSPPRASVCLELQRKLQSCQ